MESNQTKVETIFPHSLTQLLHQHDCAPAHKTSPVKKHLVKEFRNQVIGYSGVENWPKRLPDLTSLFFFQWRYLKQQVYAILHKHCRTLKQALQTLVPACYAVCSKVCNVIQMRIQMCIAANGEKFEHFK
ncbi:uncharacterized protein TNCV_2685691 [Trichonephila clavipes]|nr:uncharacterized protein TNCV_2685691 [Trichonephila clavipes]